MAVATATALADPDFAEAPETDHAALISGMRKLDGAGSPFDDPIFRAAIAGDGWSVQAVEGLTAWFSKAGTLTRVDALIGDDVTVYTVMQRGGTPNTWLPGGRFYLFHSPAAQERFATIDPPAGIERNMGDGCALESFPPPKPAAKRRATPRRTTPAIASPALQAIAA